MHSAGSRGDREKERRSDGSILSTSAMLARLFEEREEAAVRPTRVWREHRDRAALLAEREQKRERLGFLSDFPDEFRMPFNANLQAKMKLIEATLQVAPS